MKKSKIKNSFIAISTLVCVFILEITGELPYAVARTTTSIYIAIHYHSDSLKFYNAEFDSKFGEYSVMYKDKDGKNKGFMLSPKMFPIIITHDTIKEQG